LSHELNLKEEEICGGAMKMNEETFEDFEKCYKVLLLTSGDYTKALELLKNGGGEEE
jgi:hypothetical protein